MTGCCFFHALLCNENADNELQRSSEKCIPVWPREMPNEGPWVILGLLQFGIKRSLSPRESVKSYQEGHCKKRIILQEKFNHKVELAGRNKKSFFPHLTLPLTSLSVLNILWTWFFYVRQWFSRLENFWCSAVISVVLMTKSPPLHYSKGIFWSDVCHYAWNSSVVWINVWKRITICILNE